MNRIARVAFAALLAATLALGACGKDKKGDKDKAQAKASTSETSGGGGGAAAPAKPSKETCEKVANHQIELEKDPDMKSAMKMSTQGLIDGCMELTQAQADCMLAASEGSKIADCLLK